MKRPELKLSDIRALMEETYRGIAKVTGHEDVDIVKEQHHSRIVPMPKGEATNELVLVSWSAVSARSSDTVTDDDFDAGVLLSGQGEPEVTGALILGMCDRLLRMGVEAGAFPHISVPLELLARSCPHEDESRCGHA